MAREAGRADLLNLRIWGAVGGRESAEGRASGSKQEQVSFLSGIWFLRVFIE